MIKPEQIPPEALEAAAKAMWKTDDPSQWELGMARAACLAMLEAWPGMSRGDARQWSVMPDMPIIILPLTENPNDKG